MLATSRRQQYADAISALRGFVNVDSSEDLVATILAGQTLATAVTTGSNPEIDKLKAIVSPVIDVINGGRYAHELLQSLEDLHKVSGNQTSDLAAENLPRAIRFTLPLPTDAEAYTELKKSGVISGDASWGNNGTKVYSLEAAAPPIGAKYASIKEGLHSKNTPKLCVIEILNSKFGTAVRDVAGLSIFSSMVPAHIMSRAVPYVSVRVRGAGRTSAGDGGTVLEGLSLLRYIKGKGTVRREDPTSAMIIGMGDIETPASMELFTAPQTMVSDLTDIQNDSLFGSARPIDRFRPLMTMTSLDFEVAPSSGFMSYKTAKMSLVLHDRGRLADIAPFIKAGLYNKVELEIEYGWSIDTSSGRLATDLEISGNPSLNGKRVFGGRLQDDAFAQFIDSLRVIEKYSIVNTDFNFDDSGQVNINLSLAMKGSSDFDTLDITAVLPGADGRKALTDLIAAIGEIIKGAGETTKTLISENIVGSVSSENAFLALDDEKLTKVREEIAKLAKNSANKDLKALDTAIGALTTAKADIAAKVETGVESIFTKLKGGTEYFPACGNVLNSPETAESLGAGLPKKSNYTDGLVLAEGAYKSGSTSLARLFVAFVCQPLMTTNKYDEIHLIFNKFNERASFMKDISVAAFPIDTNTIKSKIKEMLKKTNMINARKLIEIINKQVEDVAHPAYGFSKLYDNEGKLTKGGNSNREKAIAAAGIKDLNFKMPKLKLSVESVPHDTDREKTILRIMVSDASANPFETFSEAIASGRSDIARFIETFALDPENKLFPKGNAWKDLEPNILNTQRDAVIKQMIEQKILVRVAETSTPGAGTSKYQIDLTNTLRADSPKKLQAFMSRSLPVIFYGNGAGLVKSISVSSINDSKLATVNMINADDATGKNPAAAKEAGLPLLLNGTEVQMELMGCPILHFMQSIYINFGTGTSIDNIYACTGLSHKMAPGQFSTSAKFILHVGAYGIYSSVKREFEIMAGLVEKAAKNTGVDVPTTPIDPKAIDIVGGEINIFAKYKTADKLQEAYDLYRFEKLGKRGTSGSILRVWRINGAPADVLDPLKSNGIKKGKNWLADDTIQVALEAGGDSSVKGLSVDEIFKNNLQPGLTCYEIPFVSGISAALAAFVPGDPRDEGGEVTTPPWNNTYVITEVTKYTRNDTDGAKAKEEKVKVDVTKMWKA